MSRSISTVLRAPPPEARSSPCLLWLIRTLSLSSDRAAGVTLMRLLAEQLRSKSFLPYSHEHPSAVKCTDSNSDSDAANLNETDWDDTVAAPQNSWSIGTHRDRTGETAAVS
jgi:hypothetical protein